MNVLDKAYQQTTRYELGELTNKEEVELFNFLIKNNLLVELGPGYVTQANVLRIQGRLL